MFTMESKDEYNTQSGSLCLHSIMQAKRTCCYRCPHVIRIMSALKNISCSAKGAVSIAGHHSRFVPDPHALHMLLSSSLAAGDHV